MKMPELPDGDVFCGYSRREGWWMAFRANKPPEFAGPDQLFTAGQLLAYGAAVREACAQIAEMKAEGIERVNTYRGKVNQVSQHAADMVRTVVASIRQEEQ